MYLQGPVMQIILTIAKNGKSLWRLSTLSLGSDTGTVICCITVPASDPLVKNYSSGRLKKADFPR
jgi:hypothetical protein